MSAHHTAEAIHARLSHPVLDADGHWIEFEPAAIGVSPQSRRR